MPVRYQHAHHAVAESPPTKTFLSINLVYMARASRIRRALYPSPCTGDARDTLGLLVGRCAGGPRHGPDHSYRRGRSMAVGRGGQYSAVQPLFLGLARYLGQDVDFSCEIGHFREYCLFSAHLSG